jgi:hypothetical protein
MKLIPLRCPNCNEPLKPDNDTVVFGCTNCHTPVHISPDGPKKVAIRYAIWSKDKSNTQIWVPFWVFEGQVQILRRDTQGGSRSSSKDSKKMWGVPRRLYVPAWDLSLHTAQEVGSKMTQRQPAMQFIEPPADRELVSASVTQADALNLLEFIVLAIEARRRDWLKDLKFKLNVGEPELWGLPSEGSGRQKRR